jgi:hypothetical protein
MRHKDLYGIKEDISEIEDNSILEESRDVYNEVTKLKEESNGTFEE